MTAHATSFDAGVATRPVRPSIFRRVLNAMIEARQRQAERQVNTILLDLDDTTLKSCGLDRETLRKRGSAYRTF